MEGVGIDPVRLRRDIDSCRAAEIALTRWLSGLDPVDPTTPTTLPGWSIGHLLTHLARNADGVVALLAGGPQYAHGFEGRNDDIDAGASRSWDALLADVERSSGAAAAAMESHADWVGTVDMLSGHRPAALLPLLRQREIEIHSIDLDLGRTFDDLPSYYLRRELELLTMLWAARQPMGLTGLPALALRLTPTERLAWLLGRRDVSGLDPAGLV